MTLQLLICTINEGIRRIPGMLLPKRDDVKYLVSWQQTGTVNIEMPHELEERDDVEVFTLSGRGISVNRNNALKNATGDILLLADDDSKYKPAYFDKILTTFRRYPKADIICFRAVDREGHFLKRYASEPWRYATRPKGTHISSVEIAFHRDASLPLFDERFGLGSKYLACGEEEIFLHDAFLGGKKIIFIPETVVETDPNTTGKRFLTFAAARRAKGAVLCYLYGSMGATLRATKYCLTLKGEHSMSRRMQFYRDMIAGIRFIENGHI